MPEDPGPAGTHPGREDQEEPELAPGRHPGAIPNPGSERVYSVDTGAIDKPHRTLHLQTKDQGLRALPHEARAPFMPGVTEMPPQTAEEQIATVRRDVEGRVQELEEMLDNADLAEPTRALIESEIGRLREVGVR